MRKRMVLYMLLAVVLLCLASVVVYYLPPVHERLAWRVDEWVLKVKYQLNPPEEIVFRPEGQTTALPPTTAPTPTFTPSPTPAPTIAGPTATPLPSPTPTITPTPLPGAARLQGVRYEDQHGRFNYCAPANLAMALSFWGWEGNRDVVGPAIKPDPKDKNVMAYEMADYVNTQTGLKALVRVGGDEATIKRLVSAGYPVLVEKGTYFPDLSGVVSWMGHYQVVTGYDDAKAEFIVQDSFVKPDLGVPYDKFMKNWRAFNYTYIPIYPPEKEAELLALLGPDADEAANYQRAAQKASDEIFATSGIDQYFAWFNRGTNLMNLQDYAGAAGAYDNAFAVYPDILEEERPWRMLWYQTGPYWAYFYTGRYYDVLNLAETTLDTIQSDKNLEESYYWRGMAKAALGDATGAIGDYRSALKYHENFAPALYQLGVLLGAQP